MYYRLKDKFLLRGYDRLPYAIIDSEKGSARFLNAEQMSAIDLCDGSVDLSSPAVPGSLRRIVERAEHAGVVEPCAAGHGLNTRQTYKKYPARYIYQVHWSITGRCNFKCRHCFLSAPDAKFGELSHEMVMSIIQQLGECGIMNVSLTGGEPLIRTDFLEIVDALLERGIRIAQIYSNGALVNEQLLDALESRNIHPAFSMSYDGSGWHDWMRGINGAEDMVNRAFALCRERGFQTGAEMCVHRLNMHTLRESIRHLGALGVSSVKTIPVADLGAWHENGHDEPLSIRELYQLYLDYIPRYYEDDMPALIMLGGLFTADPKSPDSFSVASYKPSDTECICGHARMVMYISPNGRVLPCMALSGTSVQEEFPSLTEKSIAECITDSRYMRLIDTRTSEYFSQNDECRRCKYASCCFGGCRAEALMAGSITGKSPESCELFRGGWAERVIDTVKRVRPDAKSPMFDHPLWKHYS